MAFGLSKIMLSISIFGFILGTAAYFVFNWFVTNNIIFVTYVPVISIVFAPWFISGIAGAILSLLIVYIFGRYSSD